MNNTQNLFYCYSNRLNSFLGLFGFMYIDKDMNSKGQIYKAYKRTEDLNFALQQWEIMKKRFPYDKVEKQLIGK